MKTLLQTNSYGSQPDPPWWLSISWAGVNDEDRRCTGDAGGEGQQPAAGWRKCGMLVPTQCRSNVQCWLAPCHQSHYLQKRHPCFGVAETGARAWPLLQAQEENNLVAQKFKGTQLWRVIGLLPGQKSQWALCLHFCTCWCRMQTLFDRGWLDQEECLADYGGGGSNHSACLEQYKGFSVSPFNRTIYTQVFFFHPRMFRLDFTARSALSCRSRSLMTCPFIQASERCHGTWRPLQFLTPGCHKSSQYPWQPYCYPGLEYVPTNLP